LSAANGNVDAVLENHFVGSEIPTCESIRIENVIVENVKLQLAERVAISSSIGKVEGSAM